MRFREMGGGPPAHTHTCIVEHVSNLVGSFGRGARGDSGYFITQVTRKD